MGLILILQLLALFAALAAIVWGALRFKRVRTGHRYAELVAEVGDSAAGARTVEGRAAGREKLLNMARETARSTNPFLNSSLMAEMFRTQADQASRLAHMGGDISEAAANEWKDQVYRATAEFNPGLPKPKRDDSGKLIP